MKIKLGDKYGFLYVETNDKLSYPLISSSADKIRESYPLNSIKDGIEIDDNLIEFINVDIYDKTTLDENNQPKKLCETIKMVKLK